MTGDTLSEYFEKAKQHQRLHRCGGVPYEHGEILATLVAATGAKKLLEVGTGIGYSTVCLLNGNDSAVITTIDKDQGHMALAREFWEKFGVSHRVISYEEKAESVFEQLTDNFDLIFYDGFIPQNKLLISFNRILKKRGMLVTANLFLNDPNGGRYLRTLQDTSQWITGVFEDTALSVKNN